MEVSLENSVAPPQTDLFRFEFGRAYIIVALEGAPNEFDHVRERRLRKEIDGKKKDSEDEHKINRQHGADK
jgi:hypothetical protein